MKANSSWPNDAKVLTGLLMRANQWGQKLDVFGLENFRQGWVPRWLEEMDKLEFQICLVAVKANSKGKLKKRYRRLLRLGRKATDALQVEKVLAYNCCRGILLRQRQREELEPAA